MNFARISVAGRVGADPQTRPAGESSVTSFSLAVNKRKKEEKPDWYSCNFWAGRTAENVTKFIKKGMEVVVTGDLETRVYPKKSESAEDASGVSLEIRASSFDMTAREGTANGLPSDAAPRATAATAGKASVTASDDMMDDEIPF